MTFDSCDLDLDTMTFIYELDPQPVEIYRMCNKSSQTAHMSVKENVVWIRSPYPDMDSGSDFSLLPKSNRDFLGYVCDNMFVKIRSLSPEI